MIYKVFDRPTNSGCRGTRAIFDTGVLDMVDWPEKDLINWVEWRVMEFQAAREKAERGEKVLWEPEHPLSELDLKIWLANKRDKKSLSMIAKQEYPRAWKTGTGRRGNQRALSRTRHAIERVENFLNRGELDFGGPKKWRKKVDAELHDFFNRGPFSF
jgi:hypothetical protein